MSIALNSGVSKLTLVEALQGVHRLLMDSAPVIYFVEGVEPYHSLVAYVVEQAENGAIELVTSPITLAECLVLPLRKGDLTLAQQFRQVIVAAVNTRYVPLDGVAETAALLRARYNLTLADAFQVAAALEAGCEALLTNDQALKRVGELRILVLDELSL